jgi:hypothetical protein
MYCSGCVIFYYYRPVWPGARQAYLIYSHRHSIWLFLAGDVSFFKDPPPSGRYREKIPGCAGPHVDLCCAMAKVDEKWDDELAREFGRVIYEMQLGKSRRQALRDMSDRMEVPDVTSFVAAILQADQLGVSIGKVLRIQSEQMRIRRRQRAEEKAHQAPVKMLFPMVFLIFPSMFIVLLGPAGFQVLRSTALGGITG